MAVDSSTDVTIALFRRRFTLLNLDQTFSRSHHRAQFSHFPVDRRAPRRTGASERYAPFCASRKQQWTILRFLVRDSKPILSIVAGSSAVSWIGAYARGEASAVQSAAARHGKCKFDGRETSRNERADWLCTQCVSRRQADVARLDRFHFVGLLNLPSDRFPPQRRLLSSADIDWIPLPRSVTPVRPILAQQQ